MTRLKTYRVVLTDTRRMRVEIRARSASAAIKAAERLYIDGDPHDPRFVDFGVDAFHDADAQQVEP